MDKVLRRLSGSLWSRRFRDCQTNLKKVLDRSADLGYIDLMNSNHITTARRPLTAAQKQNWYAAKIETAEAEIAEQLERLAALQADLAILREYAATA